MNAAQPPVNGAGHPDGSFPITVLLVDDQPIIHESVRRMLEGEPDITLHACADPTEALGLADRVAPTRRGHRCREAGMRKDIEFKTEDGVTLRGWLYLPDGARGRVPTVVMAHGFSAVKENYLDKYGEVFAAAGLGAVVFDNRNFGASDGKPRQHIDPWRQIADYRFEHIVHRDKPDDRTEFIDDQRHVRS